MSPAIAASIKRRMICGLITRSPFRLHSSTASHSTRGHCGLRYWRSRLQYRLTGIVMEYPQYRQWIDCLRRMDCRYSFQDEHEVCLLHHSRKRARTMSSAGRLRDTSLVYPNFRNPKELGPFALFAVVTKAIYNCKDVVLFRDFEQPGHIIELK